MNNCPCDSGVPYTECCQPVISGASPAETAEALMRARYSAYAMKEMDFIFESTHPDHRQNYDQEGTRTWAENSQWLGLEIIPQPGAARMTYAARWSLSPASVKKGEHLASTMKTAALSGKRASGILPTERWPGNGRSSRTRWDATIPAAAAAASSTRSAAASNQLTGY